MAQVAVHSEMPGTMLWEGRIPDSVAPVPQQVNRVTNFKNKTHAFFEVDVSSAQKEGLDELFAENILAKMWRVASRDLENNVSLSLRSCTWGTGSYPALESPYCVPRIRPPRRSVGRSW